MNNLVVSKSALSLTPCLTPVQPCHSSLPSAPLILANIQHLLSISAPLSDLLSVWVLTLRTEVWASSLFLFYFTWSVCVAHELFSLFLLDFLALRITAALSVDESSASKRMVTFLAFRSHEPMNQFLGFRYIPNFHFTGDRARLRKQRRRRHSHTA